MLVIFSNVLKTIHPLEIALARWLRAKFWPDCAFPDTSMKFGTVEDND